MTNINIPEILQLPNALFARRVKMANGRFFSAKYALNLAGYFEEERAARSVTYDALVQLDGAVYDGTVTIDQQGHLAVRLKH